jgi:N-acetylneuraminic acid mutarotase
MSAVLIGFLLFSWVCSSPFLLISVSISPNFVRIHVNKSIQLTAMVRNSTNPAVTWSVGGAGCSGASCGTISNAGLYTAPASVPSPADVKVKAASMADPSKSYTVTITILPAVVVTVSPQDAMAVVGESVQFTATVQNADDSRLIWSVSGPGCTGAGCGTISSSGLYTAPSSMPAAPTVSIIAASVEEPEMSGSSTALLLSSPPPVEWNWVSGSDRVNAFGNYGTPGIAAPSNVPGAREGSVSWTDPGGNLWLFGGRGLTSNLGDGFLNDLWRFDPSSQLWTWVAGSSSQNQHASYGTQGTADPSNAPGARYDSASWRDPGGNLWLFGGYGIFSDLGGWGMGNDLWKYDPVSSAWTWVSGSNSGDQPGTYGTKGLGDAANVPGARRQAMSWVDQTGALWLFGGMGFGSDGNRSGMLNDLWKYDPLTNEWTWISGSDTIDQPGVYGTKGVADPANVPGAKFRALTWLDLKGDLWLFGGGGPGYDHFNDLWKFDMATREWTWVSGSNAAGQAGVYGTRGQADPSNVPGGRGSAVSFRDPDGSFWLFGGAGYDSTGENTVLNDLWMFDPTTGQWTWVSGNEFGFQLGIYGTKRVPNPKNVPGARFYGASWVDAAGDFWLFGGWGNDSYGGYTFINDLWQGIR